MLNWVAAALLRLERMTGTLAERPPHVHICAANRLCWLQLAGARYLLSRYRSRK
jgi:hypothetical protein